MRQIVQSARTGRLEVKDVPAPQVTPGHILVRTEASLISAGTERMTVGFARKSLLGKARARPDLVRKVVDKAKRDGIGATFNAVMSRLDEPLPLGYSAAGTVIAVGPGLEGAFRVGERVAVAGAGLANHAEINLIPRNLAAPIPEGVSATEACYATLGSIALHAVRNLEAGLGDVVAVIGVGLVGQLAAKFLELSGARVIAIDTDRERLSLAANQGAEAALDPASDDIEGTVLTMTGGLGADRILIAAATESAEPFELAAEIARDRAKICLVGLSGTEFPYAEFMKKELSVVVSRSYGPGRYDDDYETRGIKYPPGFVRWTETENLGECLRLMLPGLAARLDVGAFTTHSFAIDDAGEAYALVTEGRAPHLGVVLTYPADVDIDDKVTAFPSPKSAAGPTRDGACVFGVIGAGNFARAALLPELKKLAGVTLHTLVTKRGISAENTQGRFGFAHAATDDDAVFGNADINAVLIATRHDSHAELTVRALAAGKSVLVEKPLALDRAGIAGVAEARQSSQGFFQVGFNRRFAPMVVRARAHLANDSGIKHMIIRVNAGAAPTDSWVHEATEGGGRVLGEVCHFVDLARHLVGQPITSVAATAAAAAATVEDVAVNLSFADGSLASITYTALGDVSYAKELIEVYGGGTVVAIDDFRAISVTQGGRTANHRGGGQDKGIGAALKAFTEAVQGGTGAPVDEAELIETSLATIAIMESLQSGARIDL